MDRPGTMQESGPDISIESLILMATMSSYLIVDQIFRANQITAVEKPLTFSLSISFR